MFTPEDIFKKIFPWLEGISFDVGTAIVGMLLLTFLIHGFHYLKDVLEMFLLGRQADAYSSRASTALSVRNRTKKGTFEYDQADSMYRGYLNKSTAINLERGANVSSPSYEFKDDVSNLEMENSCPSLSTPYEPDSEFYDDLSNLEMERSSPSTSSGYEPDASYYDDDIGPLRLERDDD